MVLTRREKLAEIREKILQNEPIILFPGDEIGVIEEFQPGNYTFEEDGLVKSAALGIPRFNSRYYRVEILPRPSTAPVPRRGDLAIGQIVHTGSQIATVAIHYINGISVIPTYTAIIHISQVSRGFLSNMDDAYRSGDIIRAKIVSGRTIPVQIETLDSNLGVVYSLCSKCGSPLHKLGRDKLKCSNCERTERRKTAIDYGRAGKDIKYR